MNDESVGNLNVAEKLLKQFEFDFVVGTGEIEVALALQFTKDCLLRSG